MATIRGDDSILKYIKFGDDSQNVGQAVATIRFHSLVTIQRVLKAEQGLKFR